MRSSATFLNIGHRPSIAIRIISILLALCAAMSGLDSKRLPSEYIFEKWGEEQGFLWGAVHSLAQTPDGYLWIGCEAGLVRFNGISFQLVSDDDATGLPAGPVQHLVTDKNGYLWVLERNMSLFRLKHGKAENMAAGLSGKLPGVTALAPTQDGGVTFWTGSGAVRCCDAGSIQNLRRHSTSRHSLLVISLAETSSGTLWVGSRDAGLLSLQNSELIDHASDVPDLKVNALLPEEHGGLWIGTDGGAIRWDGLQFTYAGVPKDLQKSQIVTLAKDNDKNIWVGTNQAFYRLTSDGDLHEVQASRISTRVTAAFEDREGNLWLGSDDGLARLRDSVFLSYSHSAQYERREDASPIYVDPDGRAWYSASGGHLSWKRGHESHDLKIGNSDDTIYAIAGRGSAIWAGSKSGGLTLVHCNTACTVQRNFTQADGLPENAVNAVFAAPDGSVWVGTPNGGASKLEQNRITTFTTKSGLASNAIRAITQTQDRTTWFATSEGLSSENHGSWRTYNATNGLPPGGITCLSSDPDGVLWIGASYGLAFLKNGVIRVVQSSTLRDGVSSLAVGDGGTLWLGTPGHVLGLKRVSALSGKLASADIREYGATDGLLVAYAQGRTAKIAPDFSGHIWISTSRGLSTVDSAHLPAQLIPAIPLIQGVVADGVHLNQSDRATVPALSRRLVFDFIGISLTFPQKVQYEYRLDNFDMDWSNPVATREAVYTNLSPGTYRFRIRASNSAGLWSDSEDSLLVLVNPAFWQTWWFLTLALAALICGFA